MILALLLAPLLLLAPNYEQMQALTEDWWQWLILQDPERHPLDDRTGEWTMKANENSTDVIWLTGAYNASDVRDITIPIDTALFFPIIDGGYGYFPNWAHKIVHGITGFNVFEDLKARSHIDTAKDLRATLDGKPLEYQRVTTPLFETYYPAENFYDYGAEQKGNAITVVDGYWSYIPSLAIGTHTLEFAGQTGAGYLTEVKYNIEVVHK